MRKWINLCESAKWIKVWRGSEHGHDIRSHMFFTTDERFASEYGGVATYEINIVDCFDTLDRETMENYLPIDDPYTESVVADWSDYTDRINDTWEMTEHHWDINRSGHPPWGTSMKITEGGIINYVVFDVNCVRRADA